MSRTATTRTRLVRLAALVLGLLLTPTGDSPASRGVPPAPHCSVSSAAAAPWTEPDPGAESLRVVTWNIHSGLGESMSLWRPRAAVERNLREIAADIAAAAGGDAIDVVALNEVDFGSRRSAWIDEAEFVAAELRAHSGHDYTIVRGQTWQRRALGREVRFGNAVLVRLPVLASGACLFGDASCDIAAAGDGLPPVRPAGLRGVLSEERGAVKLRVLAGSRTVDIVATHLDAFSAEAREGQAMHLLHRFVDPSRSTVLVGDLNAVSTARTGARRFFRGERTLDILTSATLADVRELAVSSGPAGFATYPAAAPAWALDAVLATVDLAPASVAVIGNRASDHRGLVAVLDIVDDEASVARRRERHHDLRRAQAERIRDCDFATDEARARRGWLIDRTGFASVAAGF